MKSMHIRLAFWAAIALISACSSSAKKHPRGMPGPEIGQYGEGPNGSYRPAGTQPSGISPDDPNGPLARRTVYFVYDSSEVQPEYLPVVNTHAGYLAANRGKAVVLEGHADERGSPEYNIALGEQRAQTVAKLMKLQGVADQQMQIVSLGEEKPAVSGHDETAWQQNRRVEIIYQDH